MAVRGGIDLGGTKIQSIVVDEGTEPLGANRIPTPKDGGPRAVAEAIADSLRAAAREAGLEPRDLAGVGVGSPGSIDDAAGTVTRALNVSPEWDGSFALRDELASRLDGTAIRLGNDVRVGTLAEMRLGAGRNHNSLIGVFWGTGVGSGVILNGKPWGGRGAAGEIGHMVVRLGGRTCTCGRVGCVEAYAGRKAMELRARKMVEDGSETKLFEIMEERGREQLTSGIWARALEHEDRMAMHLIDQAVAALASGIASAVNLLDVEAVVIGGGLGTRLGEPYAERIRNEMQAHLFRDDRPPDVVGSVLGDLGGALGAALLVE
jgi:glucokinase